MLKRLYFQKLLVLFLLLFCSFICLAQTASSDSNPCISGCNTLTKAEADSISRLNGSGEIKLYYANGALKYRETKKTTKSHKVYYQLTGKKCKEEFSNSRTHIKKTNYYDARGKKTMVCKGSE